MREVRELIRTLQTRPGRGGVRLSYEQADLCLRLIQAGALAVAAAEGRAGRGKPRLLTACPKEI